MSAPALPDLTSPGEDLYGAWRAVLIELRPDELRTMVSRISALASLTFVHDTHMPWAELPLEVRSFYQAVASRFLSEE